MTVEISLHGQRLIAECDPALDAAARSLLDKLRECHERGPALQPGSVIEFGWAPLRIEQRGHDWVLCEPDFLGDDFDFVPGVNLTLWVLDTQVAIHRDLGVPPSPFRYNDRVIVSEPAWHAPRVMMDHGETQKPGDSGWYIGPDDGPDGRGEEEISVYTVGRVARLKPVWASVFALPVGFMAIFEHDRLVAVYDQHSRLVAGYADNDHA